MRAVMLLLAACGAPAAHRVASPPAPAPVEGCKDAPKPHVDPIAVAGYPIARRPLTQVERTARVHELETRYPGWHFEVDEYGAPRTLHDDPTPTPDVPFPRARLAAIVTRLQHDGLLPADLHEGSAGRYVDELGNQRVSAAAHPTPQHETFLDVVFSAPWPDFPLPAGSHVLSIDELFARWDPGHDHSALLRQMIAEHPCDPAPGHTCASRPEPPAPRCVSVRELAWSTVVLGTGDGHQRLVYAAHARGEAIVQMNLPACIDAVTGADLGDGCPR